MQRQIISSKSRYHIRNAFVSNYSKTDCSMWARAAHAMGEQCVKDFGKVETFVSTYEMMKVMVVPLPNINSLVVLIMLPSVSVEDVIHKISALVDFCKQEENTHKEYDIAPGSQSVRE